MSTHSYLNFKSVLRGNCCCLLIKFSRTLDVQRHESRKNSLVGGGRGRYRHVGVKHAINVNRFISTRRTVARVQLCT